MANKCCLKKKQVQKPPNHNLLPHCSAFVLFWINNIFLLLRLPLIVMAAASVSKFFTAQQLPQPRTASLYNSIVRKVGSEKKFRVLSACMCFWVKKTCVHCEVCVCMMWEGICVTY